MARFGDRFKSWTVDPISVFRHLLAILSDKEPGRADLPRSKFCNTQSQMVLGFL